MSGRYEIFDILAQDSEGVVFHAEDRESGGEVVLRRFFPFGPEGGGLEGEERTAYEIAVRRLVKVAHPALRTVLAGGSDPVDGMPFLVTEWVEGTPLSSRLKERPLSPESALALADLAIETSMVLSETFGEEAIWVDTRPEAIVLGVADSDRAVTFWISPLSWLGDANDRHGLRPLLEMIEHVTGWNGRVISDSSGGGLGAWIKAIRKNPDIWNLAQARYALHHGPDAVPPPTATQQLKSVTPTESAVPTYTTPTQAARAPSPEAVSLKHSTNWWPWVITGVLVIAAAGLMVFQGLRASRAGNAESSPRAPIDPTETTSAAPAETSATTAPAPKPKLDAASLASQRAAQLAQEIEKIAIIPEEGTSGLISPEQNARLIEIGKELRDKVGKIVKFKARLHEVRSSSSGKTLYLEFGSSADPDALCIRHRTKESDLTKEQLQHSVGKLISVRGKVVADPSGRIAIDLATAEDLETLDE